MERGPISHGEPGNKFNDVKGLVLKGSQIHLDGSYLQ